MPIESTDRDLALRAKAGDPIAFGALVERHQVSVFHVCYRLLGERRGAEDLAQETFIRAYQRLNTFDPALPFGPWVRRVAANVCLNALDRKRPVLFSLDEDQRARLRGQLAGFVFQSFQLLPSLTALENVMLPLELRGMKDANQRATEALSTVGLSARLTHLPKYLSGGEQQRVALARAFVTRPKILFADEPTGNLDAETGAQIIELMLELNKEYGTTLILVTHDAALAQRSGRQLHLIAGRMVT